MLPNEGVLEAASAQAWVMPNLHAPWPGDARTPTKEWARPFMLPRIL